MAEDTVYDLQGVFARPISAGEAEALRNMFESAGWIALVNLKRLDAIECARNALNLDNGRPEDSMKNKARYFELVQLINLKEHFMAAMADTPAKKLDDLDVVIRVPHNDGTIPLK